MIEQITVSEVVPNEEYFGDFTKRPPDDGKTGSVKEDIISPSHSPSVIEAGKEEDASVDDENYRLC